MCCNDCDDAKVTPHGVVLHQANGGENGEIINKNRSCTDVFFLILYGLFLLVLIVLLSYCMSHGNIHRIINGYDNCGNICGQLNVFDEVNGTACHGTDQRKQKYLRVQTSLVDTIETENIQINRICVESCGNYPGLKTFLNRCLPDTSPDKANSYFSRTGISNFFQEVAEDLNVCWTEIFYMCLFAFVFSVIVLLMFKHLAGVIVWLVLIGAIVIGIVGTILLWIRYRIEVKTDPNDVIGKRRVKTFLGLAIVATIITILLIIVIIYLRKRIRLVIRLFEEAGKAATSMPLLMVEPVLTFIALVCVMALWLYFAIWIESSGRLSIQNNTSAQYVKDDTMKVSRWYNLMALFWTSQFIIGCQHMVIAGAVSTWFFTRNKNELDSPILNSFSNLVRFHLGTVAFGSLLIACLQLVRTILHFIEQTTQNASNRVTKCCFAMCHCCLASFQNFLQFISRNAYIETAIYGEPFLEAGEKAFQQLASNSMRVIAINSVGDFVLVMGKVFIVVMTVIFGTELLQTKQQIHHMWVPLSMAGIFAYLIAHCFITVYETIIDTIFLCFCEDCTRNDGLVRPYYMPRSLMEFVQNSKKVMAITDLSSIDQNAWVVPREGGQLPKEQEIKE